MVETGVLPNRPGFVPTAPAFSQPRRLSRRVAFTLIELLTVMAVIGILAGLIFPVTRGVKKKRILAVAQAELQQVQTAIETYKAKLGYYPPDNPGNALTNPLYFELMGTVVSNSAAGAVYSYTTLDGSAQVKAADVSTLFNNASMTGFANSSESQRGSDEKAPAVAFLKGLKPNQVCQMVVNGNTAPPLPALLACSIQWPDGPPPPFTRLMSHSPADNPHAFEAAMNPWRYVSTSPAHNPNSYDLWVEILIGNNLYRVSNWTTQPQLIQ